MVNETELYFILFSMLILTGLPFGYIYASFMIGKTGLVIANCFIAVMINLAFSVTAIFSWFFFTWRINEFLFFGGLAMGMGISIASMTILIILLIFKRKKMLSKFADSGIANY